MKSTYRVLAYVVAAGVAVQASSVALGFFAIILEVEDGGIFATGYDYESNLGLMVHRYVGTGLIPLAAIALLIVSLFTRTPGAIRWAGGVLGLVVMQIALVFVAFGGGAWGGALHGLNALALFLVALIAGRRMSRVRHADDEALAVAPV